MFLKSVLLVCTLQSASWWKARAGTLELSGADSELRFMSGEETIESLNATELTLLKSLLSEVPRLKGLAR